MNIILFNSEKDWGGGEKWYADVYRLLVKKGHQVTLFTNVNSALGNTVNQDKGNVRQWKVGNLSFLNPLKKYKLKKQFRALQADALILNLPADLKLAGTAGKKAGIKKIIYRRGSAKPIKNSFLNRWLFRHVVTDVIANSRQTKNTILHHNPNLFPAEKIKVVYNGIDEKMILPHAPVRQQTRVVLGNAGRLSPEKGHDRLLKVAKELKKDAVPFQLLIAGTGPMEKDLKILTGRYGLKDHVHFEGFVKDFGGFLSSIDIFVLTSYYEGFGYVLIEAMAAGIPVLAFDIGTTSEIIEHGKTGFIVENNNIREMAGNISRLIGDAGLRRQMGKAGKDKVKQMFTLDTMYQNLESVLLS